MCQRTPEPEAGLETASTTVNIPTTSSRAPSTSCSAPRSTASEPGRPSPEMPPRRITRGYLAKNRSQRQQQPGRAGDDLTLLLGLTYPSRERTGTKRARPVEAVLEDKSPPPKDKMSDELDSLYEKAKESGEASRLDSREGEQTGPSSTKRTRLVLRNPSSKRSSQRSGESSRSDGSSGRDDERRA